MEKKDWNRFFEQKYYFFAYKNFYNITQYELAIVYNYGDYKLIIYMLYVMYTVTVSSQIMKCMVIIFVEDVRTYVCMWKKIW